MTILERFSLKNKIALVTGAARGLGKYHSYALAEAGANVCIADINFEEAEKTAREISETCSVQTLPIQVDVSDEDSVENMFSKIVQTFETLDICVSNAGIFIGGDAICMKYSDWKKTIDVDLNGVFLTCRGAAKIMLPNKKGSIINIASMNGHIGATSPSCSYCACKSAVLNLTRALAYEWGRDGIRVNSISPGNIYTEMLKADCGVDKYIHLWEERTCIGRLGYPEELQSAILYLASDASSFTTGSDIIVDGGHTCI